MINYGAEQAQTKTTPKQAMKHATTEVASAIWWPTKSGASTDVLTRRLDGEIHLPRDVQPSFVFGRFSLTVRLPSTGSHERGADVGETSAVRRRDASLSGDGV